MHKLKNYFLAVVAGILIIIPTIASAQTEDTESSAVAPTNKLTEKLQIVGQASGFQTSDAASVPIIIGTVINVVLGFLGAIFLGLMVFAGYKWMMAMGDSEDITKAKATIKQAIIGLIVVLSSWSIWTFIFQRFVIGQ